MIRKPFNVLAINPGSRYIGTAVFKGHELRDWRIRNISVTESERKKSEIETLISVLIEQHDVDTLAIKRFHLSQSPEQLKRLVSSIKQVAKRKGLKIYQYSIKDLKTFFSPEEKINKRKLSEIVTSEHPSLLRMFNKEKHNKNPYHIRVLKQ